MAWYNDALGVAGKVAGGTAGFFVGGPVGAKVGWDAGGNLGSAAGNLLSGTGGKDAPGADPYVAQLLSQPFQYGVTDTTGQRQQAASAQQQLGSAREQMAKMLGVPVDQVSPDPSTWADIKARNPNLDLDGIIAQGTQAATTFAKNNVPEGQGEKDIARLGGYTDQLRGQQAPTLTRTDTSGIAGAIATAAGQQDAGRNQQQGQIDALTHDNSGRNQTALGGQINAELAGQGAGGSGQAALAARLNGDLNGGQPSVAENQLRQGGAANMRNALSIAAGARGGAGNQAAALRTALNANAAAGANTNAQAATLRAQEYAQARGELGQVVGQQRGQDQNALSLLGSVYGQQRGQDLNASGMALDATGQMRGQDATAAGLALGGQTTIAGINTTQNQTQAQLEAQQRALALQGGLGYGQLGNQISLGDTNARQSYADLLNQRDLAERGLSFNQNQANQQQQNQYLQMLLGGVGTAGLLASDENLKEEVKDADPKLAEELLSKLKAKTYKYKDPVFGEGAQFGILAQALERSTLGKRLVVDTPAGKMVDVPKSVGALLAIAAGQQERIRKLERRAG